MCVCVCVCVCVSVSVSVNAPMCLSVCVEEIDVIGSSSRDASTDSDTDDAVLSANKAFTMSLRLSRPL